MEILKTKQLNIYIQNTLFLKEVNFSIKPGEIIHLVGKNGSGKTTLIETLLKLNDNWKGEFKSYLGPADYGYLPQVSHQFPKMHIELRDVCNIEYSFYSKDLFHKSWHTASGGERKKALIAKAISEAKKLLILDEPFNHLDQISCQNVSKQIQDLSSRGIAVLYTGHEYIIESGHEVEIDQWR